MAKISLENLMGYKEEIGKDLDGASKLADYYISQGTAKRNSVFTFGPNVNNTNSNVISSFIGLASAAVTTLLLLLI